FNPNVGPNPGDAGDWAFTAGNDSFLNNSNPGVYNDISETDLREMDVLGYRRVADDYGADVNFAGHVAVNGSVSGSLEQLGDRDWFRVQLTAGSNYVIRLDGHDGGGGTLADPALRLLDHNSSVVASDEDSGPGLDSMLTFTPTTSGFYYMEAAASLDSGPGTYTVSVNVDDFLASTATTGELPADAARPGNLEIAGDRDWFRLDLAASTIYQIDLQGASSKLGTLSNPILRLYDANGTFLVGNDDIGDGNLDSRLLFTPKVGGTYYAEAADVTDSHAGTYRISLTVLDHPPAIAGGDTAS